MKIQLADRAVCIELTLASDHLKRCTTSTQKLFFNG